jgi:endonuclease/exonuclease/phosphatase family metal-dependent hydrolase
MLDRINAEKPDIIGFQEMTPYIKNFMTRHLTDYHIIGRSRGADFKDEHVDIAYKKETLELQSLDYFWLSPTPYVPASRFEVQSSCPRIVTSAIFKHNDKKTPFRVYNTHLDHVGEPARKLGMDLIIKKIEHDRGRYDLPFFVTGDMNCLPDSPAITALKNYAPDGHNVADLTAAIDGSYHGWGKEKGNKIDYVFADGITGGNKYSAYLWDDFKFDMYLSDHYPVAVDIELNDE